LNLKNKTLLSGAGMIITELGDKFMLIKWERSRLTILFTYIYHNFFTIKNRIWHLTNHFITKILFMKKIFFIAAVLLLSQSFLKGLTYGTE
jgi:hypothetical protein